MTKKISTSGDDTKHPDPEIDGLTTLFSSDNTELTDFTERVQRAILGDQKEQQESNPNADQQKVQTDRKPVLISSVKNNVVNLFGPK
ncbi:MAG: hypothetical protein O6938_07055 [Gammaproteobacteria bacterium]|nr:hypothetical protein [Gammaproteobacteria bacterium]MCZ6723666.1 hypothetical protein [Gammaproteobacteria bacterium]MCZ6797611.1 hypothetical protein [Gammaproteobacteria bacterium]MCZ6881862.1 hypothetical protein [Gammaproteobacteria bacterium]